MSTVKHCVLNKLNSCLNPDINPLLIKILERYNLPINKCYLVNIQTILNKLSLKDEYEIWEDYRVKEILGERECLEILETYYKIIGPRSSNALLSNIDIDKVMKQLETHSEYLYNYKFKFIPCVTIDFENYNNELRNLSINTIQAYDYIGCVLNTDIQSGRGKHWIAFVIDNKNKEILFFNSSGNSPPMRLERFFKDLQIKLRVNGSTYTKKNVLTSHIQKSKTECGVWCLAFIESILKQYKPSYISTVTDLPYMVELRKRLFRD